MLAEYSQPLHQVVCTSKISLPNPQTGESPLGNLVMDTMKMATGAKVVILDRGAVLGEIDKGDITVNDVCEIHPWRNRILEMELTGAQVKDLLANYDFLTSGIEYFKADGVISDLKINSSPVKPDGMYKVAIGEYLMTHAPFLRSIPFTDTGKRIDTAIMEYLSQSPNIGKMGD